MIIKNSFFILNYDKTNSLPRRKPAAPVPQIKGPTPPTGKDMDALKPPRSGSIQIAVFPIIASVVMGVAVLLSSKSIGAAIISSTAVFLTAEGIRYLFNQEWFLMRFSREYRKTRSILEKDVDDRMNQFKKEFLGFDSGFKRAASAQRCLRTDDLAKVGKTEAR